MRSFCIAILFIGVCYTTSAQKRLQLPQAERGWYLSGAVRRIGTAMPFWPSYRVVYTPNVSLGYRLLPYVSPQLDISYTSINTTKRPYYEGNFRKNHSFKKINYGIIQLQLKASPFRAGRRIRPYIAPIFAWRPYSLEMQTTFIDTATDTEIGRFTLEDKGSLFYYGAGVGLQVRVWRQVEVFVDASISLGGYEEHSYKTLWLGQGFYNSINYGINYHFGRKKKDFE